MSIAAKLRGFSVHIAGKARQYRIALGRHHGAALRHDKRIRQRFGQISKQQPHVLGRFHPVVGRTARAIFGFEIGRIGDAQHHVMRFVKTGLGERHRVGRDKRQIKPVREVDQPLFGAAFNRIKPPRQFDIDPAGEKLDQAVCIAVSCVRLPLGKLARDCALAARAEDDQAV